MQNCYFDTSTPEAQQIMDEGLTILARIIARDIMRKREAIAGFKKPFKNGENGEHVQNE